MTAVTYDMQKLDEAVGWLVGAGPLIERLRGTMISLHTLQISGMSNKARAGELKSIVDRLFNDRLEDASGDDLSRLAHDIADLQSANWHDAAWALEDRGDR